MSFLADDVLLLFPPLQYVELVAGEWHRRSSSCLSASSSPSTWTCRSNLNLRPNPNLNPNLNTNTNAQLDSHPLMPPHVNAGHQYAVLWFSGEVSAGDKLKSSSKKKRKYTGRYIHHHRIPVLSTMDLKSQIYHME